jgi:hypothetical protein
MFHCDASARSGFAYASLILPILNVVALAQRGGPPQAPVPPQIKIYRDAIGIGHVYAPDDVQLFYGIGRLHARDKPLKTLFNLTWGAGELAKWLGPGPLGTGSDVFKNQDRKTKAYKVPQKAQDLYNSWATGTSEEQTIRLLIQAYVQGIRDELIQPGRIATMANFYANVAEADWPYGYWTRLSEAGYQALLGRSVACWEPVAVMLYGLGDLGQALPPDLMDTRVLTSATTPLPSPTASNARGVSSYGSDPQSGSGPVMVQADSHGSMDLWHVVRLRSLAPDGIDAGGFTGEGIPFILGGFTNYTARALVFLSGFDSFDTFEYRARMIEGQPYVYRSEVPGPCDLRPMTSEINPVEVLGEGTTQFVEWYLDSSSAAPGSHPLWVTDVLPSIPPGPCGENKVVRVSRVSSLERGTANDPRWDLPKYLYRLMKAENAEIALASAMDGTCSSPSLGYIIGSDYDPTAVPTQPSVPRLTYLNNARMPTRGYDSQTSRPLDKDRGPLYLGYPFLSELENRKWGKTTTSGTLPPPGQSPDRIIHPITSFPTLRAHVPVEGTHAKFFSTCNSSPQWAFGRRVPFPMKDLLEDQGGLEPEYDLGYQRLPWFNSQISYWSWINDVPSTITASYQGQPDPMEMWYAPGVFPVLQEWSMKKLRDVYSSGPGISEQEMKDLALDRQDPFPFYLRGMSVNGLNWFDDLYTFITDTNKRALLQELRDWAVSANPAAAGTTAAKWHIFWYYFKEDEFSPLYEPVPIPPGLYPGNYLYVGPMYRSFRFASIDELGNPPGRVRRAADRALGFALTAATNHGASLVLSAITYVRVPFTSTEFSYVAAPESLRTSWFSSWTVPPTSPPPTLPRRRVIGGSRVPMLMRLRKSPTEDHVVHMMNCGIVADYQGLAEWQGQGGQVRYFGSLSNWAAGILHTLPMTEGAIGDPTPYTFSYAAPSCNP